MMLTQQAEHIIRRLRIVRLVALVDLLLLLSLVTSALTGERALVQVLGPLHGINFLLLVVIAGTSALDGLWGWWFPLVILFTAGPPGTFLGEWIIRRRMAEQHALIQQETSDKTSVKATNNGSSTPATLPPAKQFQMNEQKEQI